MLIDLYATLPKLLHSSLKLAGRIFNHQFFVLFTKLGLKTTTKSWLVDQFIYSSDEKNYQDLDSVYEADSVKREKES